MQLDGIHHITCITADGPRNADFYVRVLGMRLVKKTVNQDDPTVYHLFYADEHGSPGADLTFFEYPGVRQGRAGAGMIHRIAVRVGSAESLDFWARRLDGEGIATVRGERSLRFHDPEGLEFELVVDDSGDEPLTANAPDVPSEHALRGFAGVRAFSASPVRSAPLLEEVLGFRRRDGEHAWELRGPRRGGVYAYDEAPEEAGIGGAGTVHHIAWASEDEDHEAWDRRVRATGTHTTGIVDRFWFRSIYFREPSGVLFELATRSPGFAVDEDPERLGERLTLPPRFEHMREQIEATLQPIPNPRASRVG